MANNTVNQINSPNTVVITDRDQNQILVTQPVTSVLEVGAVGPQGAKGDTGPQGPQGDPGPQGPPGTLEAFEGIIVTGSSIFSGSTEFTNLPTIQVTGSFAVLGTASLNGSGLLTNVFTASYNTFTASYYTDSSSFSTRVTSLEVFSASLDNTFVTETELNAATASLSASVAYLSSSYLASSASFDTRISNNSSSVVLLSGSFLAFSGSYLIDSASFASRITNNSASIVALSSSFLNLSSSFLTNSSSFAARISNNSASLSFLSASYVAFSSSYNTGSFSGSFTGNGAGLFNIPASGIVGLNLSQIASGSATASISPADGFRVNTNTIITGSLTVSGSSTLINIGPAIFSGSLIVTEGITGSLLGTASYAANALTSSYAFTASYAENAGSGNQIASGSATASISGIDGFRINTKTEVTGSLTVTGGLTASSAVISGDVIVQGTASINTLVVNQTQYTSGSNQLGDAADDTQTLFGTVRIPTGSLTVTGSVFITGSIVALQGGSFSGSGANLFNIPASGITGLNLSQIATGSVTASVSTGTGSFSIVSGSTNLLFVSSSGRVGIGTTTPSSPLEVVGNVQITNNGGLTFYNGSLYNSHYITTSNEVLTVTSNNTYGAWKFNGYNVSISKNLAVGTTLTDYTPPSQTFLVSGSTVLRGNTVISGSATNSLIVRGSGTTSATTSFLVQNSAGTSGLVVYDDGKVTINNASYGSNFALNVNGNIQGSYVYGSWLVSNNIGKDTQCALTYYDTITSYRNAGSYTNTSGTSTYLNLNIGFAPTSGTGTHTTLLINPTINQTGGSNGISRGIYIAPTLTSAADYRAIETTSGSVILNGGRVSISGSTSTSSAALLVYKSGSTVIDIQGSTGQLFSITDSLTGSLFSVNTVAGLPIIEAFSDNTVNIGKFGTYPIKVVASGTLASITGSFSGSLTGTASTASFALTASYVNPLTQSVSIRGTGTTSATTALSIQNAGATSSLVVLDNGFVGIGTGSAAFNLDVNGNANFTGYGLFSDVATTNGNIDKLALYKASASDYTIRGFSYSGQLSLLGAFLGNGAKLYLYGATNSTGLGSIHTPSKFGIGVVNTSPAILSVSGNTTLSGSAGTGSALTVYKSGSTVMSIQGSQGELFSITDSLSGSLFSVSNISGLPILEVFSDNTVLLGSYLDPMLITTQRLTANSGSTVIYSLPTASYDGIFVDYVIRSGSNARAGQIMGMWSGSTAAYTDNSTTDFGSTSGFTFGLIVSGSNMVLTGSASTSGWTVRAGIRSI
jgi:hypothetical protein